MQMQFIAVRRMGRSTIYFIDKFNILICNIDVVKNVFYKIGETQL